MYKKEANGARISIYSEVFSQQRPYLLGQGSAALVDIQVINERTTATDEGGEGVSVTEGESDK